MHCVLVLVTKHAHTDSLHCAGVKESERKTGIESSLLYYTFSLQEIKIVYRLMCFILYL